LRPSCEEILKRLLETNYIDAELKDLSYDHISHTVQLRYGSPSTTENDNTVIFRDCFSASFNTWSEGMKGTIPEKPSELDFFLHNIEVEDVVINGVTLYKCLLVIPMMDCQISCLSLDINQSNCAKG
jgi:hypothetical protein